MFTYTDDQLQGWKKKYGDGNVFEVVSGDKKAVLHKPTRQDLSFANAGSSNGQDSIKFCEIILKQCWIDGDKEIQNDDDYFFGVISVIQEMVSYKEAQIKKL